VIESVELEPDGRGGEVLVARVRLKAGVARRCSRCGRRCPGYDSSAKPRRWRSLDLGAGGPVVVAQAVGVAADTARRGRGRAELDDPVLLPVGVSRRPRRPSARIGDS
jgi:hypothetical protein